MNTFDLCWPANAVPIPTYQFRRGYFKVADTKIRYSEMAQFGLVAAYLAIIGGVAIYDIVLTIVYANFLYDLELNPIGRWVMNLDYREVKGVSPPFPPDVFPFLVMKSVGTIIVLLTICGLVSYRKRIGHMVAVGVSVFQLLLAGYLTFV